MAMSEIDLANWEEELQAHSREVLERERAVIEREKEQSERTDSDRIDYIFDRVNSNPHRFVVDPAPVIRVEPESNRSGLAEVLCGIAAVTSAVTMILVTIICIGIALI